MFSSIQKSSFSHKKELGQFTGSTCTFSSKSNNFTSNLRTTSDKTANTLKVRSTGELEYFNGYKRMSSLKTEFELVDNMTKRQLIQENERLKAYVKTSEAYKNQTDKLPLDIGFLFASPLIYCNDLH